ncbi:MAG: tail fiber domain-containing protein [Terriglobales bacterium]
MQPDKTGHYTVLLGSTTSQGLPASIFTSGEAHWLGVQVQGQEEQLRVLLVSAPYALKAGDAETVGGLPPSAFVLAATPTGSAAASAALESRSKVKPMTTCGSVTSDGTAGVNALAKFTTPCNVEGSAISESSGNVGIGVAPATTTKLYLSDTQNNFGTAWGQRNVFNTSATSNGTNSGLGLDVDMSNATISSGVTDGGYRMAIRGIGEVFTPNFAGSLSRQWGVLGEAGIGQAKSGAKVTSAVGGEFDIYNNAPGTTITNAYGVYISNSGTLGTITNRYDLYASSGNAKNYFAGKVGIGTTTPTATLDVNGTVNAATSFNLGGTLFASGNYANLNAFVGFAGNLMTTGDGNTATGVLALVSNTQGFHNTASGAEALYSNTTGSNNTAFGYTALLSNITGGDNTAIGQGALEINTGSYNTASGYVALQSNTTGYNNTASGYEALFYNGTGYNNTASGYNALSSSTAGYENTASGSNALSSNTGNDNTADGYSALSSSTTGYSNTASGAYALQSNTTGGHNTALGYEADVGVANLVYATAIGANAVVSQSNALVLGGTGSSAVNVGIGTATPSNVFTIASGAGHAIADGWDTYSSRRWKTNIQPLHGALGKVEQLRGVSYDLKASGKHEVGVIAEEVGVVVPEVVSWDRNGKDAQGVHYGRLTALLIEATKEQQREIQRQQAVLSMQAAAIRDLKSELRATRQTLQKVKAQVAAVQPRLVAAK